MHGRQRKRVSPPGAGDSKRATAGNEHILILPLSDPPVKSESHIAEIEADVRRLQNLAAWTVHWPSREAFLRRRRKLLARQADLARLVHPEWFVGGVR